MLPSPPGMCKRGPSPCKGGALPRGVKARLYASEKKKIKFLARRAACKEKTCLFDRLLQQKGCSVKKKAQPRIIIEAAAARSEEKGAAVVRRKKGPCLTFLKRGEGGESPPPGGTREIRLFFGMMGEKDP